MRKRDHTKVSGPIFKKADKRQPVQMYTYTFMKEA